MAGYDAGMILRQNGTKFPATLTTLDGKLALLIANEVIVALADPTLRRYLCAQATPDEIRALKKAGWPFGGSFPPPPTDDDPLF